MPSSSVPPSPPRAAPSARAALIGGLLPVIAFTVIEESYGPLWGIAAGMVFGVGEILYEWKTQGRVQAFTWIGNAMLFGLGGITFFTSEGVWFKLQPAILGAAMALMMLGSCLAGSPLLVVMAEKQGAFAKLDPIIGTKLSAAMRGMTWRFGLFLIAQAALSAYAAIYLSTRAWALLKGVGFTGSMIVYLGIEVLWMRRQMQRRG